ncbi:IDEAL domain-containing protein [Bacillus andreraoultii]|uniref:IDEAL domain-containing protein n=1 Tax=Bacillus andreraoultii TaxID=1499685 RepID=UPI00053AA1E4|nr:IDEAL domain-containing protein [Bacillus andreraoultii]
MKNEKSFAELTKAYAKGNYAQREKFIQSVYIDLLIKEALLKERKRAIKEKIDEAIDNNDKKLFFTLSSELLEIEKQLNA